MAFFDETTVGKYKGETISRDYIIFQILKIIPLCVVLNHNFPGSKGPIPHGKGLGLIDTPLFNHRW
jgi:hypothetical protein